MIMPSSRIAWLSWEEMLLILQCASDNCGLLQPFACLMRREEPPNITDAQGEAEWKFANQIPPPKEKEGAMGSTWSHNTLTPSLSRRERGYWWQGRCWGDWWRG